MIETVLQPLIDWVTATIGGYGLFAVFALMLLESMGFLIPSEAISPFAGYLVSEGKMGFVAAVAAGVLGNLIGSWITYFIAGPGLRSGASRGRARPRTRLLALLAAAALLRGALHLLARLQVQSTVDTLARRRARADDHGHRRRGRPLGGRAAVGGGVRLGSDSLGHGCGRRHGDRRALGLAPPRGGDSLGREPGQRRDGPRGPGGGRSRRSEGTFSFGEAVFEFVVGAWAGLWWALPSDGSW
jgi:hypothetical protein